MLERQLSSAPVYLLFAGEGERGSDDLRVYEGHTHFCGSCHTRTVGEREVEAGKEQSGVCETHPVHMIVQVVVFVDLPVFGDDVFDTPNEVTAQKVCEFSWVIQGVTAAECFLLG